MTERKYSVSELDALRKAVKEKLTWGYYTWQKQEAHKIVWGSPPSTKKLEETVRTHMLAGHTAEDLYESEKHGN